MYALAYFMEENNYEVIPTDWIENFGDSFEDDMEGVEYVVNWRKGKSGKIIRCPATIIAANVDRLKMVELANGATRSSLEKQKGRGKREKRRNPNYEAVEEEESVMEDIPKKRKQKKNNSEQKQQQNLLRNISEKAMPLTDTDESELDQTLSKFELQSQLDISKYKIKELNRENIMLRKSLSLFQELPSLLDQVRELKDKAHQPRNIQDGSQDNATMEKAGTSSEDIKIEHQGAGDMVELAEGVNVKRNVLARLSKDPKKKVTELMSVFFTRQLMASSSLSGKQTNAWRSLDAKKQLDPSIVAAIAKYVQEKHAQFSFKDVTNVMRMKLNNESKNRAIKTEGTFSGAELLGDSHGD